MEMANRLKSKHTRNVCLRQGGERERVREAERERERERGADVLISLKKKG